MRLKKNKKNKSELIAARVSVEELNKIKTKANIYAEGNISQWIVYSALNCKPKKTDLE